MHVWSACDICAKPTPTLLHGAACTRDHCMPLATKRVSASCIMQTRHNNHSATIEQEKTMAERYPSPVRGTAQYCSRTFPRWTRARSRQGAKPRMIPRNLSRSTQVSHTPFSPASSPCAPEVPVLTRSKSLPDLREDLPRTNRSVLQKWEESDVAKHRSTLGWEISVRTTTDV